jgi:hypothetical protein
MLFNDLKSFRPKGHPWGKLSRDVVSVFRKSRFLSSVEFLPLHIFQQCVDRYDGNCKVKEFTCLDQYYCMAFAQIKASLRDVETSLRE